jgi:hypothetical protein
VVFGFNDHAYGNDATISLTGAVGQAVAAVSDPGSTSGGDNLIPTTVPPAIPHMYDEGQTGGFLGIQTPINNALAAADIPQAVFWYPLAFGLALLLGFGAYSGTKSLFAQCVVSGVVMAFFCGGGTLGGGLLPYWTVVVFALEAGAILLMQNKETV